LKDTFEWGRDSQEGPIGARKHFTPEFKREAFQLLESGSRPATFVPTRAGWLNVAVVLDLHSCRIVGWDMSGRQSPTVVIDACCWPGTSCARRSACCITVTRGVVPSMSRKGNCYDNAPVESFFSSQKNELLRHRRLQHHVEARYAIAEYADYIEVFYKRQHLHQALSYRSPEEFGQRAGDP
jgi:transposase InsO family protein